MSKQRLDKFIANQLIISRAEAVKNIRAGSVCVNGAVVRCASFSVDTQHDAVTFKDKPVAYKEYIYIIMNKPSGVISASSDTSQKTVVDLVPSHLRRPSLFPVGRLDKDTTGLMIITDDGKFAHDCISPKKGIPKCYIVTLDGNINDDIVNKFKSGITLADGTVCAPAELAGVSDRVVRVTITEGKYHQIKRMFGTVGLGVEKLHRESVGGLKIPENLGFGECIETDKEYLIKTIIKFKQNHI